MNNDDIFLPNLYFIELEDALPGANLPKKNEDLKFNDLPITPLIPLNPILLDYFKLEDLVKQMQFQIIKIDEEIKVRFIIHLPLSKAIKAYPFSTELLHKDYELKEENALGTDLPVLQVWPNFQATGWKEYYVFYYDGDLGEKAIRVGVTQEKYRHRFPEEQWHYQISQLESFSKYIQCFNNEGNQIGLIFLKTSKIITLHQTWKIGISFDDKFTNIYINNGNLSKPLQLEDLQLQVTETPFDTIYGVLFEHFIPQDFIPLEKPLPLASILTTKGCNPIYEKMIPIIDGRIYIPDFRTFDLNETWINTNLKWTAENLPFIEVFLKHLALHITALAANTGVKEIQWCLSYPSNFSSRNRIQYAHLWNNLIQELEKTTGIKQIFPDSPNAKFFRSESLALAQYFADFERRDLVYSTCIYLLDVISDISIWENNQLIHQCSVQLAERDVFAYFLELNPQFLEEQFKMNNPQRWKNLRGESFNAKLDNWLRLESESWLEKQRPLLQEEKGFQEFLKLTLIGLSGLYYYIGILLKELHIFEKYQRGKITPVYIGGRGAKILNWLDASGKFTRNSKIDKLFSKMMSKGSNFEDTEQNTYLSQNLGDEVAFGLVLHETKLTEKSNVNSEQVLSNLQVLEQVCKFLYDFHKELNIEGIGSLKDYNHSSEREKNPTLFKETEKELDKLLLDINDKSAASIKIEPSFILGLKALLRTLGKNWANSNQL